MKLREECIGNRMITRASNGMRTEVVIKDDPKLFKYYRVLGLDVFQEVKKTKRESTKGDNK